MKVKRSNYNMLLKNDKGDTCLFNTRTCAKLKFSPIAAKRLNALLDNDIVELNENDVMEKELYDKQIFLPLDYDEVRWIELKFNQMVYDTSFLSVTIMPTINCNFRCAYCYETPKETSMDKETLTRVKKFFDKKIPFCKQVKVSWFGGEPLLCKDVVLDLMEHIDCLCKKYGAAVVGTMNTNGYLLDVDTFKKLVALRVRTYEICIDGPKELHNIQRPHFEKSDSYQVILSNLLQIKDKVRSHAFKIGIRTNITPQIEPLLEKHLDEISKYFSGDNRFYVSFQGVRDWGGSRIADSMVLGTEKEKIVNRDWHKVANTKGLPSIELIPIIPFAGYCDAPRNNGYVINYDGTLHKCTIAMFSKEHCKDDNIGFIDQYGNPIVDEEKLGRWIVRPNAVRETCKKCKIFPMCVDGSCAYQKNLQGNNRCNPINEMIQSQILRFDEMGLIPYCSVE